MPAATTKAELLAAHDKAFAKLNKTLQQVDGETAALSARDDTATIKGVIAHRIHWMEMFFGWYEDGQAGRTVHIPAEGYKWNQLKDYNARLYAEGARADWQDLLNGLSETEKRLRGFIEMADEAELYGSGDHPWTGKWTLGRWAEASGASHFRSADKYVRKVLRDAAKAP